MKKSSGQIEKFGALILLETPHEKQVEMIKRNNAINLIITGNRFGKTRGLAQKHIYYCVHKIGLPKDAKWATAEYNTMNCSFEYTTAMKVFDNIERLTRQSPYFNALVRRIDRNSRTIEFINNSKCFFFSLEDRGKHVEGEAFRLITIDEVGYAKDLPDIYFTVLKPRTMGVGGFVDFVGTPKESTDPWLEELWSKAKTGAENITFFEGSTYDNVYLNRAEIKELERQYEDYPHLREMVLYGRFLPRLGKLLSTAQLLNAIDETLPSEPNGRRTMFGTRPLIRGRKYVSFWDMAFETDWTVGVTLDITKVPYTLVNYTRVNKQNVASWNEIFKLMKQECERYEMGWVYYDATSPTGGALQESMEEKGVPAKPVRITSGSKEFSGYTISKDELINNLELAFCFRQPIEDDEGNIIDRHIEWGKVRIPKIRQLIDELAVYHRDDKKLTTDSVIALAGAITVAPRAISPPRIIPGTLPGWLRGSYI
ncbi:terminase family protein [Candidatus Oleimmundimicrobium sp.]|uniref:terminase large subunit domain-containing protein n=1 Tax=Candidatus Oleimmundimicrobium sp. TaxID=3060597 RepID=UPI002717DB07|nr:terminase family protein [Candidatus Oleimmundimicrobium sp.]MDO8885734.1 hypothetical protein [Candidatus Oleimmundimicrobium sp.]